MVWSYPRCPPLVLGCPTTPESNLLSFHAEVLLVCFQTQLFLRVVVVLLVFQRQLMLGRDVLKLFNKTLKRYNNATLSEIKWGGTIKRASFVNLPGKVHVF